ncbi:hypothetical protein CPB85DRAFT_1018485 [Mucidula mucida]|nr:hypothetical protein CPB85DRAFT_1018485 [Mucidula mucida]
MGSWSLEPITLAAIGGLFVQWATTGSAIWFAYVTPTAGLGCHSASFILYGSLATLAFALSIASTILEQFCHPTGARVRNAWMIRKASIILRRSGKIIAWINCVSFILLCLLRFAHQYDNCYCGCAVLGHGNKGFQVFVDPYLTHGYFRFWIASIIFSAVASVLLYMFTWANGK